MNDLFILGAGASVPYGFPSGEDLFAKMRELNYNINYSNDPLYKNIYKDYNKYFGKNMPYNEYVGGEMCNFSVDIKNSSMISIDDFLRNRRNLKNIQNKFGKIVIADKILDAERNYKTDVELRNKIDWFNYLFSFIDRNNDLFNDFSNNSTFITFKIR